MTDIIQIPPANNSTPPSPEGGPALATAIAQLEEALSNPALNADPLSDVIRAFLATISALQDQRDALRKTEQAIKSQCQDLTSAGNAQREQTMKDLIALAAEQRNQLNADFATQHRAALSRIKTEERAQRAKLQTGITEVAKETIEDLLHDHEKFTHGRALKSIILPAVGLVIFSLTLGIIGGWWARGASAVAEVSSNAETLTTLSKQTQQTAAVVDELTSTLRRGMSVSDLINVVALHDILAPNIAKVPEDVVPAPCIAAVPDGTIRVGMRAIKSCVIPLRDNVTVRGGDFLFTAMTGRKP
jgi:cell division protein FtsB